MRDIKNLVDSQVKGTNVSPPVTSPPMKKIVPTNPSSPGSHMADSKLSRFINPVGIEIESLGLISLGDTRLPFSKSARERIWFADSCTSNRHVRRKLRYLRTDQNKEPRIHIWEPWELDRSRRDNLRDRKWGRHKTCTQNCRTKNRFLKNHWDITGTRRQLSSLWPCHNVQE